MDQISPGLGRCFNKGHVEKIGNILFTPKLNMNQEYTGNLMPQMAVSICVKYIEDNHIWNI